MNRTVTTAALFRGLEPDVTAELIGQMQPVDFAPGQIIFARGDLGAALYILVEGKVKGKVKLGRCADDGRENLLTVLAPPDMLGELSILDPGPQPWTVTALTQVRTVMVDRMQLHAWIDDYPAIGNRLLSLMARRLRHATDTLADLAFIHAPARVAKQLLGLAQRFGIPENGSMRVKHDLTQEELAQC